MRRFMKHGIHAQIWLLAIVSAAAEVGHSGTPASQEVTVSAALSSADSGATNVLTLACAIRLALEHNPELRAANGRVEAAIGRARQARVWPNPELELTAEDWPTGGGVSEAKQTVGVVQTIPFPGKKRLDHNIGMAGLRATEAEWELRRRDLVREVKVAFAEVLAAQQLVTVAEHLVEIAEAAAEAVRQRVEAGAAAEQEQLRAEIALEQARAERWDRERTLTAARQRLATLLGRPELKDTPISGALTETGDAPALEQPPEAWLVGHPGMVAMRTARDRAEWELRRARLEAYPDVKLGVAGGREGTADRSSIVEFRVSLPLPILDRSKGRQQEARANVAIVEAEAVALEQRLRQAWAKSLGQWRSAAARAQSYRERILPKAEQALRLVQRGFEEGKFGLMDLLDTHRTAAETQRAYVETLLELNTARAELEALLGAMPAPDPSPSFLQSRR